MRDRLSLGLGRYNRSLIRPLLPVRSPASREARNDGVRSMYKLSSDRLRRLLKKLRKLLLNRYVWYLLLLILKVLKLLEDVEGRNE